MPQRKCCISTCISSLIEGAVLHSFPNPTNNCAKFHTWVINTGLEGEDDDYVFKNRRICNLHFEQIYHYPKNRLNRLAVPTLNLPDPSPRVSPSRTAIYPEIVITTSEHIINILKELLRNGHIKVEQIISEQSKTTEKEPEKSSAKIATKRKIYDEPNIKKERTISYVPPVKQRKDDAAFGLKEANVGRQNKKKKEQILLRNIKVLKLNHAIEKKKMLSLIKKYQYRCRFLTRKINNMKQKYSQKEEH